jgi:hypothetical protein
MKIHIILKKDVCEDLQKCEKLLKQLREFVDLTDINEKQLYRYGIITGTIPDEENEALLVDLRSLEFVSAVGKAETD